MKPLEIEQIKDYSSIGAVSYAPDGGRALFIRDYCNSEGTGYSSDLMLIENRAVAKVETKAKVGNIAWLDDTHILWNKIGKNGTEIFSVDIHSGDISKIFEVYFKVVSVQKVNDQLFLLMGKINVEYPDLYKAEEAKREEISKKLAFEDEYYTNIDELPFYYFNGRGFVNKKRTAVFLYDLEKGECIRISEPEYTAVQAVSVGRKIYYYGKSYTCKVPSKNTLMEYDIESGETVTVADNFWVAGLVEAEGKLIFLGSDRDKYSYWGACDFYIYCSEDRELKLLAANDKFTKMGLGSDVVLKSDRSLKYAKGYVYFVADDRNAGTLFKVDAVSGNVEKVIEKEGAVVAYAISPKRNNILISALFDMLPNELYMYNAGEGMLKPMTGYNSELINDTYIAIPERYTVDTCGESIDGWVMKPYGYEEGKKYPAVLCIHGGPLTAYGEVFHHDMQLYASKGYFVFFCNPVGSDGRGNAFADIRGQFGNKDYQQIMDFTDFVLRTYPQIDEKRMAVTGGSYAGFMTNWIIGHTDRFCCACSERSISNWISFYGTADIGSIYAPEHMATDGFKNPEIMWEHSPMKYALACKTPTLFIQCDDDGCAPLSEAMQMYSAIVDNGVPSKLMVFKGENHSLSRTGKPFNKVRRLKEIHAWFEKYMTVE